VTAIPKNTEFTDAEGDRVPLEKGPLQSRHLADGLPACRLRLNGMIRRIEHTNRYVLTSDGIRAAIFYTKLYNRPLRPLLAANEPRPPPKGRSAPA